MDLKKVKIISTIIVFLLAFPLHFAYDIFPSNFTAIFFPVNESIWEHMKLFVDSFLIVSLFEYFILHHFDLKVNNFWFTSFIGAILSIPLFLLIFLPGYYLLGEKMWFTFLCMFITIALIEWLELRLFREKNIKWLEYLTVPLIIITYIIFGYLTFYPPHQHLFFDTEKEVYGLSHYKVVTTKKWAK